MPRDWRLRAFGGGPLLGDAWMRMLYLDESGIGKIEKEPIIVVAGVIIHIDTQWGAIANQLGALLRDATPPGVIKAPKYLHATDIFHGTGEFPRSLWPKEVRHALLDEVGKIPFEHNIPVVWSSLDRRSYAKEHPDDNPREHVRDAYTVCAVTCFMQTELYMRERENDAELASIMLEQNAELQKRIPEMIEFGKGPPEDERDQLIEGWDKVLPYRKLIDMPSCQPKSASSILQLADYCAFAIMRQLCGKSGGERLVRPLLPQMLLYKEASGPKSARPIWNPVHRPSVWGNRNIVFRDGEFVDLTEKE